MPFLGRLQRPAVLLAGAVLLLVAGLERLEPRFFLRDDNAVLFFPAYVHSWETVKAGELPLLDQHQMFGATFLASGITGVFLASLYPAAGLLELAGSDLWNLVDLLVAIHLVLAALGMRRLLRELGVRPALACALSLCWAFLPFVTVVSRSWVFVAYLAAFLPWNQWLLQLFLAAPSGRRALPLLMLKTVYIFYGYFQYVALLAVFETVFVLVWLAIERGRGGAARRLAAWAAVQLAAGLLAAPLLVPMWNAKEASLARAQRISREAALAVAMTPAELAAAQLFEPLTEVLDATPSTLYFLGPLWLAGLALAAARPRRLDGAGRAALAAGLTALAMSTALYYLLYLTPLFATLRWPFKSFPIAAFFLLLPAAQALEAWADVAPRRRLAIAGAGVNLALQLALLAPEPWRAPFTPYRLELPVAALRAAPLLAPIGDQGRVARLAVEGDPPAQGDAVALGFLFATLAGKYSVHGYDPLRARLNADLLGLRIPNHGEIRLVPGSWRELAARPPARYLIVAAASRLRRELAATPAAARLLREDGGWALYEAPGAPPIVLRLEDGKPLPFRWRTNGLELDLPDDFAGGHVLFDVAGLPGYRWYRDGELQGAPELLKLRPLVALPPGGGRIELRYVDRGFELGLAICAGGLLLLLVVLRREKAALAAAVR